MKYIRTKDGIFEVNNDVYIENDEAFMRWFIDKKEIEPDSLGKVIKQTDTIEELCDEFVGVDNTCENGHQLLRAIPYKCANFWNGGVYGAIWTDKGLIYVAKMDDEGKLVLM